MKNKHSDVHHHDHGEPPSDPVLRVKAIESLLVEKGLIDPAAIDVIVEAYETKVGPRNGAKVIARAWTDPGFKSALMEDATAAIATLGFTGRQGEHMKVWKIRITSIIWSSVRCVPVILGQFWACPPYGINQPPTGLGLFQTPKGCWLNLTPYLPKTPKYPSGIQHRKCGFWSCPKDPQGATTGPLNNWKNW